MGRRKLTRADKIRRELKAAQAAQGLTQEQVASVFGVSQAVISHWYADFDSLKHGKARQLCRVLGLTVAELDEIE